MFIGSCTTSPSMCPSAERLDQVLRCIEADELHLAGPAVVLEHAQHAEGAALVRAEDAVDREAAVGALVLAENRFALLVRALDVRARVLVRAHDLDARVRAHRGQEALFALGRAVAALGVPEQDDAPASAEQRRQLLAAQASADFVVGGDEADVVVALQPRVDDHDRDLLPHRRAHRRDHRRIVERCEDDARGAAADGVLDLGDLGVAIVLAQGSAPGDVDVELRGGFERAGMYALPEGVRRALGNHRDRQATRLRRRPSRREPTRIDTIAMSNHARFITPPAVVRAHGFRGPS